MYYYVVFETTGLENNIFGPTIKKLLGAELINGQNEFARRTNEADIYTKLNNEFEEEYPDYKIKDNPLDSVEYIEYLNRYLTPIVNQMNEDEISKNLEFYLGPEHNLMGRWKADRNVTIEFYMKKAES